MQVAETRAWRRGCKDRLDSGFVLTLEPTGLNGILDVGMTGKDRFQGRLQGFDLNS